MSSLVSRTIRSTFIASMVLFAVSPVMATPSSASGENAACGARPTSHPDSEAQNGVQSLAQYTKANGQAAVDAAKAWADAAKACTTSNYGAEKVCYEACSGPMQESMKSNNQTAVTNGAKAPAQHGAGADEKANLERNIRALQLFKAQCAPAKADCENKCAVALQKLNELEQKVSSVNCDAYSTKEEQALKQGCEASKSAAVGIVNSVKGKETNSSDLQARQGKQDECKKEMSSNMANASEMLAGLMSALAGAMQNMGQSEDSPLAGVQPTPTIEDCANNPNLAECRCLDNPRLQGCPMASNGSIIAANMNPIDSAFVPNDSGGNVTLPPSGGGDGMASPAASGDSGGSGAGGGGGGGLMAGGAGGGGATPGKDGGERRSPTSANILGGSDGGGGGGGSGGLGDSGLSSPKGRPMPGRPLSMAARAAATGPLTKGAGRSNWEKVKLRYGDNTPSFLKEEGFPKGK